MAYSLVAGRAWRTIRSGSLLGALGLALAGAALGTLGVGCGGSVADTEAGDGSVTVRDGRVIDGAVVDVAVIDGAALGDGAVSLLALQAIDPPHGPFRGGTKVQVRGRNFTADTKVFIGGRQVDPVDVEILDSRRLNAITPAGNVGPADVFVTDGVETALLTGAYHYDSHYLDPDRGAIAGGTWVRILGSGTQWDENSTVTVGGRQLANPHFVTNTEIQGITPPGLAPGSVDVVVQTGTAMDLAEDAYTYYDTTDPISGGLGGGPLAGTLSVSVLDYATRNYVVDATVYVGDPRTPAHQGQTNTMGQVVFSGTNLVGRQSMTVAKAGYEIQSFVLFNARNATVFLIPYPPPPMPGTPPPGRFAASVSGVIAFGGPTGAGTTTWDLVPEPRDSKERKVAHVFTSRPDLFTENPSPGSGERVVYTPGLRGWRYNIIARPGAIAVVALAGIERDDPSTGRVFTPFAMGVRRNVVVGPGEVRAGADILVDLPLDVTLQINLDRPPPRSQLEVPNGGTIAAFIDLGGEGLIELQGSEKDLGLTGTQALIGNQPPLVRSLGNTSYTLIGSINTAGNYPASIRVMTGVTDVTHPIVISEFHGIPRAVDPLDDSIGSAQRLEWAPEGGSAFGTFNLMTLTDLTTGLPIWRVLSRGDVFATDLPNLTSLVATLPGLTNPPDGYQWVVYSITVPGVTFDQFTYRLWSSRYWSGHALNFFNVFLP